MKSVKEASPRGFHREAMGNQLVGKQDNARRERSMFWRETGLSILGGSAEQRSNWKIRN
jgi:hypothetical protein